jgi:2-iminobutanoate/2-iminopropanoate deaminase
MNKISTRQLKCFMVETCGFHLTFELIIKRMKQIISTTDAPAAIGPYSQAVLANDLLFVSGQIPIDAQTSELVAGDIKVQTGQVIRNIEAILKAAGYEITDVVKTTCYLINLNDFQQFNEAYTEWFKHRPARVTVEVSRLPRNAKVEIEVIAAK